MRGDFLSRIKFAVIGGDYRYKYLSEILRNDGWNVCTYGNKYCENQSFEDTMKNADILIAPIPLSKDDINIYTEGLSITAEELIDSMNRYNIKTIICGVISRNMRKKFSTSNIAAYDLFDMEEVAIKNAVPTAEGAVMTAIQESARVLFDSKALVIGYGRCGKILSHMLKGIGADISVTFRKKADEAYINAYGMTAVDIKQLEGCINKYDFIFNTAPAMVLDSELLKRVRKGCVIIDLAQAPGGVDYSFARELNIKALYCPGLPGRIAPYTAAEILRTAVISIVQEL